MGYEELGGVEVWSWEVRGVRCGVFVVIIHVNKYRLSTWEV